MFGLYTSSKLGEKSSEITFGGYDTSKVGAAGLTWANCEP